MAPDTRTARLSEEVYRSLELAPASDVVQHNLPFVTFSIWRINRKVRQKRHL